MWICEKHSAIHMLYNTMGMDIELVVLVWWGLKVEGGSEKDSATCNSPNIRKSTRDLESCLKFANLPFQVPESLFSIFGPALNFLST